MRNARLGGIDPLLHDVAGQFAVRAGMEIHRFPIAAQRERHVTAGGVGVAKVPVFVKHEESTCRDRSALGDFILHQALCVIAEEPAADVDGLVRGVVQFDPVRRAGIRVRQHLVDDHRAEADCLGCIVVAGRTAGTGAGPPEVLVAECHWIGRGRVSDGQRETQTVGGVEPAVLETEIADDSAGGVLQFDAFARVGEIARVLAGHVGRNAILGLKRGEVSDHHHVAAGRQLDAGECEIDAVGEAHKIQVDRLIADIGQLDVFRIRIDRMIHDLADPQILRGRPDRKDHIGQRTPGGAAEQPGLDRRAAVQRHGIGIADGSRRDAGFRSSGPALAGDQLHRDQEVRTGRAGVEPLDGQDIGTRMNGPEGP